MDRFGVAATAPRKPNLETREILEKMSESSEQVTKMFEEMMKRFDAQTDLIEKKFEDQRTINEEIALEVMQLGRRVAG